MSGSKRSHPSAAAPRNSKSPDSTSNPEFKPALKPRPALMVVLGVLLALWLAALVVMRLKTVQPPPAPTPAATSHRAQ